MVFSILLYCNPGWDLEKGSPLTVSELIDLKSVVNNQLDHAIHALKVLTDAGFENQLELCDIIFFREDIEDKEDAINVLLSLGLDPEQFSYPEDYQDCECSEQSECSECGCKLSDDDVLTIIDDDEDDDESDEGGEASGFEFGVR